MYEYEEEFSDQIVYNAIKCPDGTILESFDRHDYKTHLDTTNNTMYVVDGGTSYLRRNSITHKELSVTVGDGHELVRYYLTWGSRGKLGDQPLKWIALKDMPTNHIRAVLDNCNIAEWRRCVMEREIEWRE